MKTERIFVLGVPVDTCSSVKGLLHDIIRKIDGQEKKTVFSVNPEKIIRTRKDPELLEALSSSDFLIPDGIGVVIAAMVLHKKVISRITGIDLMQLLLKKAERESKSIYLFGGRPEVVQRALVVIKRKFPRLRIAGSSHGYVDEGEINLLVNDINSVKPDILFVGLGSPRQEKWIFRHKHLLNASLSMGIGGSLDVLAGQVSRAPLLLRNLGLEWFYRLVREPNRFRRQLALPKFFLELIKEKLS